MKAAKKLSPIPHLKILFKKKKRFIVLAFKREDVYPTTRNNL